ncbi:MAG: hypothetical protein ACE5D6_04015 [Candidatus Zixiibacteriota bacterium]
MHFKTFVVLLSILFLTGTSVVFAQNEEEDIVQRYLKRIEKKHTKKLTWMSAHFTLNRINRDNDYNKFATFESNNFQGTSLSWLGDAKIIGLDLGIIFKERFAWSLSGEYWLKLGEELNGSFLYSPLGTNIQNLKSEIKIIGFSTGLQYYFLNHPQKAGVLESIALRGGGSVGFYQASWDLWPEYNNLNLSTNLPTGNNTTFKGSAPSFTINLGADYPINVFNIVLGIDMSYLYLNFNNIAWYNNVDEEVIVSYNGNSDGRVDLNLSGIKGKIEIKRFFSW